MKSILQFLITTLLGGLLFLVPIVVLVFVLGKALDIAHKLLDPLVARMPVESIVGLRMPMLMAISLILLFCFIAGLLARRARAQKIIRRLEAAILSNIPGYDILKSTSESILRAENQEGNPVVLVRFDDGCQIGLKIEELDNGLIAVFIPDAPRPQSGSVFFMTTDRVIPAGIPITSALKCLKNLGGGSNALLSGILIDNGVSP
jgi:uncharacterized membrane protein